MNGGAGKHKTKEQRKVGDMMMSMIDGTSFKAEALEVARDQ